MRVALGMFLGFTAMEAIAWAMHKWIMHGPLWILHRSHHVRLGAGKGPWEANDAFGIFFSGISIALIGIGAAGRPFRLGLGVGLALYGLAYLLVHDAAAHGRFGNIRMPRIPYLRRLVRDHRIHHSGDRLDGTRNFGFLWPASGEGRSGTRSFGKSFGTPSGTDPGAVKRPTTAKSLSG